MARRPWWRRLRTMSLSAGTCAMCRRSASRISAAKRRHTSAPSRFANEQLGIANSAVVLEYVCGAANLLDDYSSYLTGDQLSEVYSQIEGNFVGLGIELKANSGALEILRVIPGSPAERGGLRPQD